MKTLQQELAEHVLRLGILIAACAVVILLMQLVQVYRIADIIHASCGGGVR